VTGGLGCDDHHTAPPLFGNRERKPRAMAVKWTRQDRNQDYYIVTKDGDIVAEFFDLTTVMTGKIPKDGGCKPEYAVVLYKKTDVLKFNSHDEAAAFIEKKFGKAAA
jgi:hypothetical protein